MIRMFVCFSSASNWIDPNDFVFMLASVEFVSLVHLW